jgi:hypothetical protein
MSTSTPVRNEGPGQNSSHSRELMYGEIKSTHFLTRGTVKMQASRRELSYMTDMNCSIETSTVLPCGRLRVVTSIGTQKKKNENEKEGKANKPKLSIHRAQNSENSLTVTH